MAITNNELVDYCNRFNRSMDDYQLEHFVVKSQVTKFRQLQQALIELRSRLESLDQIRVDIERAEIGIEKWKRKLETEEDNLEIKLINLEIRELQKNIRMLSKRVALGEREVKFFSDQLSKDFNSIEELEEYIEDPDNERVYWISRMAKQAALDMACLGRISVGNMDSIAMMNEEDQMKTLEIATQYSGLLNVSINKIQQATIPYLQSLEQSDIKCFPSFDGVEKQLELKITGGIDNEQKNLQSSY